MATAVVVSASYDKQIRLWDAASGRTVKSFVFQDSQINSLFLLPDTGYLAVAGFGALRLYDLPAFLHSGGAAPGGGAGGAGGNASQAPPVFSSFESQSSMNFTSLAAVPLVRNAPGDDHSSTLSGSSRQLTDSASSAMMNDQLLGTVVVSDMAALLGNKAFREVSSLLIATSEDGHIRFFDANSAVTLRMLKDIATGAAITCSAVSPDRRYLLTGNQMGQVSMWHLPSIVASVALEMKAHSSHKVGASGAGATRLSDGSPVSGPGGSAAAAAVAAAAGKIAEAQAAKAAAEEELAKAFGRTPLQDINFLNDYSAIRSIAIEPLARWAAVATNAGKVHFIRLAREGSVGGSKAFAASADAAGAATQRVVVGAAGAGLGRPPTTPPRGRPPQDSSANASLQVSPQKSTGHESIADSLPGASRLPLTGRVGSYGESGGVASNSYHGPRETIYRSALVVNELSSNARRGSDGGADGGNSVGGAGGGGELKNTRRHSPGGGGASHPNSMGAVLLDHLEQHQNSLTSRGTSGGAHESTAVAAGHLGHVVQQSPTARLVDKFEMEVFETIQAHYKYILRVLISPNAELLVTCSADYSVGRFLVPAALRLASPAASLATEVNAGAAAAAASKSGAPVPAPVPAAAAAAAAGTANVTPSPSRSRGEDDGDLRDDATTADAATATGNTEEPELRNDTFSPSFASTQVPPTAAGSHLASGSDQPLQRSQGPAAARTAVDAVEGVGAAAAGMEVGGAARDAAAAAATTGEGGNANAAPASPNHSFDGPAGRDVAGSEETPPPRMEFQPLKPLAGHHRWVWDGVFSDCSNFLFTASSDNTLRMWNGLTTERPQSVGFVGHTKPVVAVLLCYDKRRLGNSSP